ncbi:MAG: molybdopterin molybdotransferase MoeA [Rhodospirillales bacterium]|jgi:molybdopterin molybdotransferase|nr:molybdopterin molybdotransferase MoeA [Rhodospirillales bacterium]
MISVAEAVAAISSGFTPLSTERIGLTDALGRVLAEDVVARLDSPFADVSAMDGYAVRAADVANVPATLTQIGESAAGLAFQGSIGPGQCTRIFTGAPVPEGADAIVIQEDTTARDDAITMNEAAKAGRWVRRKGMDFAQGDVLLSARTVLTGRHIGLAAAMNVPWLTVRRKPRVAILATGDELVMPGEAVGASQIISSNSLSVAAYVHELGGNPINLGIARDSEDSLRKMLTGAQGADLLITIGGASVGDHDLVRRVLDGEGFDLNFFRVAMRPGKPLIFGQLGRVPVLGLPGNPVSAGVTAVIFLRPAMNIMLGTAQDEGPAETALLGCDVAANDQRQDYLRATLSIDGNGQRIATPFDAQDSAMMARFAAADCLVIRPPHATPVKAGDMVEIIPL